jgi:hypothetical protein
MGWMSGVQFLVGRVSFPLRHLVQTGSGAHTAYFLMGTREALPPVREPDRSPPSTAEIKNAWSHDFSPTYVFMAWYLFKHRGNFTFTFYLPTYLISRGRDTLPFPEALKRVVFHPSLLLARTGLSPFNTPSPLQSFTLFAFTMVAA